MAANKRLGKLKVKICGITNFDDAFYAAGAGADIIGMVFAESPRCITVRRAVFISNRLPAKVKRAGVFVNEDYDKVNGIIKRVGLDFAQLHGDEGPAYIKKIKGAKVIKALRVKSRAGLKKDLKIFSSRVFAFLFDSFTKKERGGTGKIIKPDFLRGIRVKKPFFIAGGVNSGNASDIAAEFLPYGLDVSSGVEIRPGKKSRRKMREFFSAVRGDEINRRSYKK